MTPIEAHDYTLEIVREFEAAGMEVKVTKYGEGRSGEKWDAHYKNVVEKYGSLPDHVPPERWCRANFKPVTDEHRELLAQKQKELGWLGICFDHGGGCGGRDWELDWSFRVKEGPPDGEREEMVSGVNDMIAGLEKGTLKGIPSEGESDGPPAGDQGMGPFDG